MQTKQANKLLKKQQKQKAWEIPCILSLRRKLHRAHTTHNPICKGIFNLRQRPVGYSI